MEQLLSNNTDILAIDKENQGEEKTWENPVNPEKPADHREDEQIERQYQEAKRRHDNLTETDHIDKEKKS